MTANLTTKKFGELSLDELYSLLALRSKVFVVEQDSAYHDPDGLDQQALHILAHDSGELAGYARLLPPGLKYDEPALGRLVTSQKARKSGIGKQVITEAIRRIQADFPGETIRIEAQHYLKHFYEGYGFVQAGGLYELDGISHIVMLKEK